MIPFKRKNDPHALSVGMAGAKMGDRIAMIGCGDGGRLAAIAAGVGLSGRAVAIVGDAASEARLEKGARAQGVLIEIESGPPFPLALDENAFDLVIVDDSAGLFTGLGDHQRVATAREVLRVLRPGGRAMVIGATGQSGLSAMLSRTPSVVSVDAQPAFQSAGFKAVRLLGAREGLSFVEGVKSRDAA